MALTALPLAASQQLQLAARNNPAIKYGSRGEGVMTLQQVLSDLGYPLPISTASGSRVPDGDYGSETTKVVHTFQAENKLSRDGAAGELTLHRLDSIVSAGWYSEQLKFLASFVYAIERLLASSSFALTYPDSARDLRRECDKMHDILRRYGKAPNAEDNPFLPVVLSVLGAEVGLVLGLRLVIVFGLLMIFTTAITKLPMPKLPDVRDFLPKVDPITTTGVLAGAVLVLKIALDAAKRRVKEIGNRLRRCLERALSPMCKAAIEIVLELIAKILDLVQKIETILRTGLRGDMRNVPRQMVDQLKNLLKLLEEAAKGVSDTGCCSGAIP